MTKELEALRGIISKFNVMRVDLEAFYRSTQNVEPYIPDINKEISVIEAAIKRLEKLDEPKKIVDSISFEQSMENYVKNNCPSVGNKLKALEIIKEKEVNVGNFKASLLLTYEQYQEALDNDWTIVKQISKTPLTQKEYNLLKEYFK